MIPYRGKTKYIQFLPKTPHKFGIKGWSLTKSTTGYLLKFNIYEGKDTNTNSNTNDITLDKNIQQEN
jgi:hypothetical protein